MDRRQFCAGIVAGALPLASARAQTWPDKPVNIILSQPPGSGPDNIARLLADRLGHMWGKVVVILNKPGGQNIIGAQAAARSAPDGYTFYFATTAALVSNVYLFKQLPYDPTRDFTPVAMVCSLGPQMLSVNAELPVNTLAEFAAYANANRGKLSIAFDTTAGAAAFAAKLINKRADLGLVEVPYRSAAQMTQDVASGVNQVMMSSIAVAQAMVDAGGPLDQSWLDSGEWTVEIGASRYPAKVSLRPLYDPGNARIRS